MIKIGDCNCNGYKRNYFKISALLEKWLEQYNSKLNFMPWTNCPWCGKNFTDRK